MKSLDQLDPNFVLTLEYSKDNLAQILAELSIRGLEAVTRPGSDSKSVLVFTRVEVDRAKNDDLYTITQNLPFIISQTPLYDEETSKRLDRILERLIKKDILGIPTNKELVELALLTGNPDQSLYFAFLKYYIHWLIPLSIVGVFFRVFFGRRIPWEFNKLYSVCLFMWSILFTANWVYRQKKHYISLLGGVHRATLFQPQGDSGKPDEYSKVLLKKCCFIPIALLFATILVLLQLFCFGIEILVTQLYAGPLVRVLSILPTALICSFTPILTMIYNKFFVSKFVKWENGSNPQKSTIEKNFVLTFFISYMPLIITLFIYLPFGYKFTNVKQNVSFLNSKFHIPLRQDDFVINVKRYRDQILYFTITNQLISIAMENFLPLGLHIFNAKMNGNLKKDSEYSKVRNWVNLHYRRNMATWDQVNFLQHNEWGCFDFDENMKKIVVQFGYVSMFSVIWPLSPLLFLAFNIVILKLDIWRAIKRCTPVSFPNNTESSTAEDKFKEYQSPSDSWNVITEFILMVASIIGPTLTFMYSNCKLPGIGYTNSFQKRDQWYMYYPFEHRWYTIFAFAFFMEHMTLFTYYIVCKIVTANSRSQQIGHIPVNTFDMPSKTNLLNVALETNKDMDDLESELKREKVKVPARRSRKPSMSSIKEEDVEKTKDIFDFTEESTQTTPKKIHSENFPEKDESKEVIHSSPKFNRVLEGPRILQTSPQKRKSPQRVEQSSTAGATLPDSIPTSKNFHLRNGRGVSAKEPLVKVEKITKKETTNENGETLESEIQRKVEARLKNPVDMSPKQKPSMGAISDKDLATKAAATVVKADREDAPITPLQSSNETPEQKDNEVVVPLKNITNIRKSLSLRRKSIISDESDNPQTVRNEPEHAVENETEQENNNSNNRSRRPSIKGLVKKIKDKL